MKDFWFDIVALAAFVLLISNIFGCGMPDGDAFPKQKQELYYYDYEHACANATELCEDEINESNFSSKEEYYTYCMDSARFYQIGRAHV